MNRDNPNNSSTQRSPASSDCEKPSLVTRDSTLFFVDLSEEEEPLLESNEEFEIIEKIGKGGMGVVFRAREVERDREVALKIIRPDYVASSEARARFKEEVQVAASIQNPNSVLIYGYHEIHGNPAISMELLSPRTLGDLVGQLEFNEVVSYSLQILDGLDSLHRMGLIHRDIKPANCFISEENNVKLGDFGLVLPESEGKQSLQSFAGSPHFASPEQAEESRLDSRSDLYSMSAMLYLLLSGRVPHNAVTIGGLFHKIIYEEAYPLQKLAPHLPRGLCQVVMRGLSKDPSKRMSSAAEYRDLLLVYADSTMQPAPLSQRAAAWIIVDGNLFLLSLIFGITPVVTFVAMQYPGVLSADQFNLITTSIFLLVIALAIWLRSPGMWIFRLRIVRASGRPAGFLKVLNRTFWFGAPAVLLGRLETSVIPGFLFALGWHAVRLLTLPLGETRRCLDEYLSGTRVVRDYSEELRPTRRLERSGAGLQESKVSIAQMPAGIVPKHEVGELLHGGRLLIGKDTLLNRDVLVCLNAAPPDSPETSDVRSLALIREVNRISFQTDHCIVLEDPGGFPVLTYLRLLDYKDWRAVRTTLLEVSSILERAESSPVLGELWIDSRGRARCLPIPLDLGDKSEAKGAEILQAMMRVVIDEPHRRLWLPIDAEVFLRRLLRGNPGKMSVPYARDLIMKTHGSNGEVGRWKHIGVGLLVAVFTLITFSFVQISFSIRGESPFWATFAVFLPAIIASLTAFISQCPLSYGLLRVGIRRLGAIDDTDTKGQIPSRLHCVARSLIPALFITIGAIFAQGESLWLRLIGILISSTVVFLSFSGVLAPHRAILDVLFRVHTVADRRHWRAV